MKDLFQTAEEALRAALSGGTTRKARKPAFRAPKITVLVNARPADDIGPSIYLTVTTSTISRMEAEMEALRESRRRGLRMPVVIAIEKSN